MSGIGGVDTGRDAAEFILLGSDTVQVCTGVMVNGSAGLGSRGEESRAGALVLCFVGGEV